TRVYADSAEQVLIRGLRTALGKASMGQTKVVNALKSQITDRIFATTSLTAKQRLRYVQEDCESWKEAVSMAVWNPKKIELERLDDGSSDIDTLDAYEYTFERDIKKLLDKPTGR
ncbi:MAG: PBSX family phage terminase large subunit, partial [Clostridiales bacterium]|nr:PBSX family phage terminase large subunit [Clostridiales bacterium]